MDESSSFPYLLYVLQTFLGRCSVCIYMCVWMCVCIYVYFFLSRTLFDDKYNLHSPLLLSRRSFSIYNISSTQSQFSIHSLPVFLKGSLVARVHLAVVLKVYTPQSSHSSREVGSYSCCSWVSLIICCLCKVLANYTTRYLLLSFIYLCFIVLLP